MDQLNKNQQRCSLYVKNAKKQRSNTEEIIPTTTKDDKNQSVTIDNHVRNDGNNVSKKMEECIESSICKEFKINLNCKDDMLKIKNMNIKLSSMLKTQDGNCNTCNLLLNTDQQKFEKLTQDLKDNIQILQLIFNQVC